jgi:predicted dehydrogenase
MSHDRATRREFLQRTSAAATAVGATSLLASSARGAVNDQIAIGLIGVGGRGSALMSQILALADRRNCRITAVCDVWRVNRAKATAKVASRFGATPRQFSRYQELLGLADIDAVVIATPDFSHCPIMIAALRAGKDIYVEKPMATVVADANQALDLARANHRVVQVGTQYRSHGGYRAASRELASGILGPLNRVSATANFNQPRWARDYADCKEEDVDWKAFLMNLSARPFDPRLIRRWQLYRATTNGLAGLWMSHYADAVHLLTGAKYPRSAVSHGGIYVWKDGREHTDTFHTLLDYPEGFLFDWGMGLANSAGTHFAVYGTRGTLDVGSNYVDPNSLTVSAAGGSKDSTVPTKKIVPAPTADHMDNWLECLRTRARPNADIQFGHQHAVATIMAARALETGRRQTYDPNQRRLAPG